MPRDSSIQSVLIIGSGPIVIGQGCEFDYAGTQAARALREEGIEVSLINSNPATIMTDDFSAHHIYLLPLTVKSIIDILEKRPIDAVLTTMGGQTALNLVVEAEKQGIWKKYGVRLIGADIAAIEKAENRDSFTKLVKSAGLKCAESHIANSYLKGKEAAQKIGFPLVIRSSYTLGGTGGSVVMREEDFDAALKRGLHSSHSHEALVEKAMLGWKEFELELLRDANDNVAVICTIENIDPMGIHTGDSITVTPALTLPDTVFQTMRNQAKTLMRLLDDFAGGCNVQFALHPETEEIIVIEINPRVSRSSALASKATGYPIAKIAAKLAIGLTLDELKNPITGNTSAFFEPALDYVVVKMPRWNFDKFQGADHRLGIQMKSVGEVMAIGRNFLEALQKACQSQETNRMGLGADMKEWIRTQDILQRLEEASDDRIYRLKDALRLGIPEKTIYRLTHIDYWYIRQVKQLVKLEEQLVKYNVAEDIPRDFFKKIKEVGYSDAQIAWLLRIKETDVYQQRKKLNLRRSYKMVDTCAAEFEAQTPYYYSTFDNENESIPSARRKILVIGAGPNRIGQGIEFDYCCVNAILAIKESGFEAIMLNCNPETVSTDADVADKLYFDPIFWEHIEEILELENPEGVIIQFGGQSALKFAEKLQKYGANILGTGFEAIDMAEDRAAFCKLLSQLQIAHPQYVVADDADDALIVAKQLPFPVIVRPSYVLGGQKMKIVINNDELEQAILDISKHLPHQKILIDQFLAHAKEAEIDAICDGERVHIMGIMEHIEPAGIHSGDSAALLPTFSLSPKVLAKMQEYTEKIAFALGVKGFINVQFAIKNEQIFVIEANPRASRTVPFIAKAYQVPYLKIATQIILGTKKLSDFDIQKKLHGFAIKVPVFSFDKFPELEVRLGPEMKSTGEMIYFIESLDDPFFIELQRNSNMYLYR